ncbi:hypothetical protein TNCV_203951 [Trichonephila clavipes]|nr:hypothetical protein TNCV_203951 [Trichonephila clavipes]
MAQQHINFCVFRSIAKLSTWSPSTEKFGPRRLGRLKVACVPRKPKFVGSISTGVDRFSGCGNRRHACHMIMWYVKDPLNINFALSYSRAFEKEPHNFEPMSSNEDNTQAGTPSLNARNQWENIRDRHI